MCHSDTIWGFSTTNIGRAIYGMARDLEVEVASLLKGKHKLEKRHRTSVHKPLGRLFLQHNLRWQLIETKNVPNNLSAKYDLSKKHPSTSQKCTHTDSKSWILTRRKPELQGLVFILWLRQEVPRLIRVVNIAWEVQVQESKQRKFNTEF